MVVYSRNGFRISSQVEVVLLVLVLVSVLLLVLVVVVVVAAGIISSTALFDTSQSHHSATSASPYEYLRQCSSFQNHLRNTLPYYPTHWPYFENCSLSGMSTQIFLAQCQIFEARAHD
jgi:hypothetical protein